MAGGEDSAEAAKLTGLAKHFNSATIRGRANVTLATYGTCAAIALYFYLKPSKKAAPKEAS